eukprot:scaffold107306_cov66-Phaeocystis_antarctica.AAC.6
MFMFTTCGENPLIKYRYRPCEPTQPWTRVDFPSAVSTPPSASQDTHPHHRSYTTHTHTHTHKQHPSATTLSFVFVTPLCPGHISSAHSKYEASVWRGSKPVCTA